MVKRDKGEEGGVTSSRTVRLLALVDPIGRWRLEQKILSYQSIALFEKCLIPFTSIYKSSQAFIDIHQEPRIPPSASRGYFQARDDGTIPPSHVTICTLYNLKEQEHK
jgi:hypothetical protein